MTYPILVIGVGADGPQSLPLNVKQRINEADHLWGSDRLLAFWSDHPAEKTVIGAHIADRVNKLKARGERRIVILASGDPGFYGIASTLLHELPAGELEIIPLVSSLQLAFARAGLTWSDAMLTSAHARPLAEVVGTVKRSHKTGILTDPKNNPAEIARVLLAAGIDNCRAIVAENLGMEDERLVDTWLADLQAMTFASLSCLIIERNPEQLLQPVLKSRPDSEYSHRRGMITKQDIRALSLVRLSLRETDVVWDIGAGSGAMSIEMAELAWRGQVFAIEHDETGVDFIRQNLERYGVLNIQIVQGFAPEALADLPSPNAVFIGGSSGKIEAILGHISSAAAAGCRIVANFATLENLLQASAWMRKNGWEPEFTQACMFYSTQTAGTGLTRLEPNNPVFILSGVIS